MPILRSLLVVVLVLLASCAVARPPELPESMTATFGTVSGSSRERVRHVARLLDELAPQIPLVLPGCDQRQIDVRLVAEMAHESWSGATYTVRARRWMELPENEGHQRLAATMAHELVHYLLGREWSTLPGVLEEGLCDSVAHILVPECGVLERGEYAVMLGTALQGSYRFDAERMIGRGESAHFAPQRVTYTVRAQIERADLPAFEEALRLDSGDLEPIRVPGVRGVLDALGYLVVSRIGIEGLFRLCQRAHVQHLAQVPSTWLLEAAGLERADSAGWLRAIDALCGDAEKRALLRREGLNFQDPR